MKETSYIYFADAIENGDHTVKIGETVNLIQRTNRLWRTENVLSLSRINSKVQKLKDLRLKLCYALKLNSTIHKL